MFKILIVDDEESVRRFLISCFRHEQYEIDQAGSVAEARDMMLHSVYDLVITDLRMDSVSGMELVRFIKSTSPHTEVMMMTGYATVDIAVQAMKEGACDFITKPLSRDELLQRVKNALNRQRLEKEVVFLRSEFQREFGLENIVGESKELRTILDTLRRIAPSESTVLITGETGTGKELVAKAIHTLSRRANKPFVSVNCAAFPEHLLESELFGHVKGAFTGASTNRKGLIEEAHGGTFFLDEIGTMPLSVQAKLLRVLEDRTIRRIGENRTITVDIRIIAATNLDFETAIQNREFREDLYYRLNVVSIHVPPLRARRSDIPALTEHFLKKYCQRENKIIQAIAPEAMQLLLNYNYPGNVRELKHIIEQAVAMCAGPVITCDVLPPHVREGVEPLSFGFQSTPMPYAQPITSPNGHLNGHHKGRLRALDERERELILEAIGRNQGNLERAAKDLGISRVTLWRRMKKYGIRGTYTVHYG
ncbi:MAG: sigma-54 dependent transcriptional regulator [Acidobacteriota bacterium]|nr:sigma-54 dependent transcriptional regulator [Blastocatellia bacterium]MDW8241267.1 sigma-54 dependent transcriptional regulator [Acidobacteriota bacterium]